MWPMTAASHKNRRVEQQGRYRQFVAKTMARRRSGRQHASFSTAALAFHHDTW